MRECSALPWAWMRPLPAFKALHLAETPQLVLGHSGVGQSQPWPMAPGLAKEPEDRRKVTAQSGPGLQFCWSERAGLGAAC